MRCYYDISLFLYKYKNATVNMAIEWAFTFIFLCFNNVSSLPNMMTEREIWRVSLSRTIRAYNIVISYIEHELC